MRFETWLYDEIKRCINHDINGSRKIQSGLVQFGLIFAIYTLYNARKPKQKGYSKKAVTLK